ncbi:unnamed protein product, partial [marine sediment metagenome]
TQENRDTAIRMATMYATNCLPNAIITITRYT